jgi:hypothetical protein
MNGLGVDSCGARESPQPGTSYRQIAEVMGGGAMSATDGWFADQYAALPR